MDSHQSPRPAVPRIVHRHESAPARLVAAILLTAGLLLAGGPVHADIIDPGGHQFHSYVVCNPGPDHSTTVYAYSMQTVPVAFLTLRNVATGVTVTSEANTQPNQHPNDPTLISYSWSWIRPGDQAVFGQTEVWVTYLWADGVNPGGPSAWEQITDIRLQGYSGGQVAYCSL